MRELTESLGRTSVTQPTGSLPQRCWPTGTPSSHKKCRRLLTGRPNNNRKRRQTPAKQKPPSKRQIYPPAPSGAGKGVCKSNGQAKRPCAENRYTQEAARSCQLMQRSCQSQLQLATLKRRQGCSHTPTAAIRRDKGLPQKPEKKKSTTMSREVD